jgi:hypothetical protein
MPASDDVRDLPYVWRRGYFAMDEAAVRRRLRRSEVVIGDVRETVRAFMGRSDLPPLGFVSFDLDYYTSTKAAFDVLRGGQETHLPRTYCYFDDLIGGDAELHSRYAGELLAIDEFNDEHPDRKLAPINGLRHKRRIPAMWNDQLYVLHAFGHPAYATHLGPPDWQLALRR